VLAAVLSSLAIGLLTQLWDQPLHVPFQYAHAPGDDEEDATLDLMLIKNVHETGWFNTNPKLNAPFEQHWAEWPMGGDLLAYTIKKGMVDVTGDVPLTFNLFWLLTFPLTALIAFPALRSLRVSWSAALVGAVLFSLAPYHFRNGAGHENLAFYVGVPIVVLVCMRVLGPDGALPAPGDLRHWAAWWRLRWLLLGTVLVGVTGIYYLAFLLSLLAICAGVSVIAGRRPGRLVVAGLFAAVGLATSALANLPTLLYRWQHPANLLGVPDRRLGVSEAYPLRIVELLSPVTAHRFGPFAFIADQLYSPGRRGTGTAMLGLAGSIGFVVAIFAVLILAIRRTKRRSWSYEARVGILVIGALVLGTAGGLGRALELVGLSGVRAWTRIAIVVAFASLVVFGRLLDRLRVALVRRRRPFPRLAWTSCLAVILVVCTLDQAAPASLPNPAARAALWREDRAFVAKLEHRLPKDAMVFQLPVVDFPEHGSTLEMSAHDLIKEGYLHSKTLRWSTGGIRGRSGEWQWPAAKLHSRSLLRGLAALGFSAVMLDRNGFSDLGDHRVHAITAVLGEPVVRGGDHLVAWDLRRARSELLATTDAAARSAIARRMLEAPLVYLSTDVDPIRDRGSAKSICRTGELVLVNPSHHHVTRELSLNFAPRGLVDRRGYLTLGHRRIPIVADGPQHVRLVLAPGRTNVGIRVRTHDVRCESVLLDMLSTVSASLVPK
jgi:hypothetical protein